MKNDKKILINNLFMEKNSVIISFEAQNSDEIQIEAWLESQNKYNPNIFYIDVDNENKRIIFDYQALTLSLIYFLEIHLSFRYPP